MSIKQMYDIIEAGYLFSNIQRFNIGENPVSLPTRLFYAENLVIKHEGAITLTESDYSMSDIDLVLSSRFNKNVYKKLFITNPEYQSGMLEITILCAGDYLKATDISDIKNEIDTKFNITGGEITGGMTVQNIMPNMIGSSNGVSTRTIGSPTQKFKAIYADDIFVGASSLYVNGKKVIEDVSDVIEFKTSIDQGLAIRTTATTPGSGSGNILLNSDNLIDITGRGGINIATPTGISNKNIIISSESSNGQVMLSSLTEVDITAPIIDLNGIVQVNSLIVEGNLTVTGTTVTLNTQTLTIQDNIIELNNNQSGIPASSLISGITVNRGDSPNYRFIFQESTNTFRVGEINSEQPVATRQDIPVSTGVPYWNDTSKRFDTSSALTFSNGNLTISSKKVVTITSGTSMPGSPTLGDMCYRTDLDELYFYQGATWIQI